MNNDIELAAEGVKRVILASAPERIEDFNHIWKEYNPQIVFTKDKKDFSIQAGPFNSIIFNHKTMCKIWILGFAMQKAFNAYSSLLAMAQLLRFNISDTTFNDDELIEAEAEIQSLISSVLNLADLECIDDFQWPENIPLPIGKPKDLEGSLVFDLLCMAAAYCFLHELQHVIINASGEEIKPTEEEMRCDEFARKFLLAHIEEYSKVSGYPLMAVKNKRAMSIALATVVILVFTPKKNWYGSITHPSVGQRILALTDYLNLSENDLFWSYFSSLLLSQIRRDRIKLEDLIIQNQKDFCLQLINLLNK
ncbi:MAG: hypothetical protein K8I01_12195 [Candidatus Methylomirabilis sp.]|nr:hypothetical protein [Deltaproteobacteria bacterium]